MPEQRFGGALGSLLRIVSTVAGRVAPVDGRLRTRLSPLYGSMLYALSVGRGVSADLNGESFRLDPRFRWFLQPHYEAELAEFLRTRVRPGQCCLDIGAHVGVYALQIARWTAPGGRVIAFEPNPGTAAVLRRHVRMNGLEGRVRVEEMALGRLPGSTSLFGASGSGLSRLTAPNPEDPGAPSSIVSVLTVDSYCAAHDLDPDWILIDVEGFELDVLEGAAETIRRRGRALSIVVEMHPTIWPQPSWTRERAEALLQSIGRRAVAVGAQRDPLADYGAVMLECI